MSRSGVYWWILVEATDLAPRHPQGCLFCLTQTPGGDTLWCVPSPVSSARGLFFVVINGGQAQQGGSRLG